MARGGEVIAVTLTAPRWGKARVYRVYRRVVKHYTGLEPTYIVTHCVDDGTEAPVGCIGFHPVSPGGYAKYIARAAALVARRLAARRPRSCTLIHWGPVLAPLRLLFPRCRAVEVTLGDWAAVAYWKLYYTHGARVARLAEHAALALDYIAALASQLVVTNSAVVAKRLAGLARLRYRLQPVDPPPPGSGGEARRSISYIGRLDYEKGVHLALAGYLRYAREALAQGTEPLPLEVAGTGPLEGVVRRASERTRGLVRYHGFLERRELSELYARTLILVIPSHTEGVPSVLLEALAARVPYVAANADLKPALSPIEARLARLGLSLLYFEDAGALARLLASLGRRPRGPAR